MDLDQFIWAEYYKLVNDVTNEHAGEDLAKLKRTLFYGFEMSPQSALGTISSGMGAPKISFDFDRFAARFEGQTERFIEKEKYRLNIE